MNEVPTQPSSPTLRTQLGVPVGPETGVVSGEFLSTVHCQVDTLERLPLASTSSVYSLPRSSRTANPVMESPREYRDLFKQTFGPVVAVYERLAEDPERAAALDRDFLEFATRTNSARLSASFHSGSCGGKWDPMSPSAAAPRRASVMACRSTSASEALGGVPLAKAAARRPFQPNCRSCDVTSRSL